MPASIGNDRLNLFEPWDRPAHHEDRLTRGLLVVLRYSPLAHRAWLSRIERQLPAAMRGRLAVRAASHFDTQKRKVLQESEADQESIAGISVLVAGESPAAAAEAITERDHDQVLDGIVKYGTDLVVVIESKLEGPVWTTQHEQINLYGQPIRWLGQAVSVTWRDFISDLKDLEDNDALSGAEAEVISDFLLFVDLHFPRIGPFTTLTRCGTDKLRIQRRLGHILDRFRDQPGTHELELYEQRSVRSAFVDLADSQAAIGLYMWPANTVSQAREFYRHEGAVAGLLDLLEDGWWAEPDLLLRYRSIWLQLHGAKRQSLEDYVAYWQENIGAPRRTPKQQFKSLWKELATAGFASEADREGFERDFLHTKRPYADLCPGLFLSYDWPLEEARRLDETDGFGAEVRNRINEVLDAFGEEPLQ
jgi:hypothetical protein